MKSLMILFILSMLVQPAPVSACDMDNDDGATHHAAMTDQDKPDCCQGGDAGPEHPCGDMSSCGHCPAGLTLAYTPGNNSGLGLIRQFSHVAGDYLADSHSHPPFRPPIS